MLIIITENYFAHSSLEAWLVMLSFRPEPSVGGHPESVNNPSISLHASSDRLSSLEFHRTSRTCLRPSSAPGNVQNANDFSDCSQAGDCNRYSGENWCDHWILLDHLSWHLSIMWAQPLGAQLIKRTAFLNLEHLETKGAVDLDFNQC